MKKEINNINTEVFWRDKATPKSRIKNKMERRTKLFIISEGEKISKNWKPTIVPNTVKDPRIECPRITGTIAAFNIKVKGNKGYLSSVGKIMKASALRVGVFIRPLGDVVYLMPPLCITDEELEKCYFGIQEGLKAIS